MSKNADVQGGGSTLRTFADKVGGLKWPKNADVLNGRPLN